MDIRDKTKEELISELQVILQENNSLKVLKEKEEAEFIVANQELLFQNEEKENRAAELILANKGLVFQNEEKEKRAAERMLTENQIKEISKRNHAILKAIPDLMFRINSECNFIDYQANSMDELYVPADSIIGRNIKDILPPVIADLTSQYIKIVLETGELQTFDYSLPLPIGLSFFEARMTKSGDKEVVAIVRNITKRKETEEEIYNLNIELEMKVEQRTKQLGEVNKDLQKEIEERKLSEKKVKEKEASLKEAQRMAKMGGWELDLVTQKTNWSDNYYEILGFKPGEVEPSFDLFISKLHPYDVPVMQEYHAKIMQKKKAKPIELRIIQTNGSTKWIHIEIELVLEGDKIVKLKGVIIDITERKLAEEQLLLQSTALNAAANTIVITSASGKIEWVNPAFTKLTGYTLEEVTGENPRSLKSGKHDDAFYKSLWDTVLAGNIWHGEILNKRKDGSLYNEEMTITPLTNENGEIIRFIAIKQDITERKQIEEEINKLQRQIDYIFGATKTGLIINDAEFNLQHVNPASQKIYGNFTGRKCYEYFKGLDKMCEECLVPQSLETKKSMVYETTYPLEDNRAVQATIIPFQDKDGEWLAAKVTVDITERKKFEDELSIAKAEAERANLAKSEFLSRMSHELRTPMNSILGFAQLMNMGELTAAHKKGVEHILKSGKHLLELINEVLDLSRIEAGKLSLSIEPVQLSGIISEMLDVISQLASGRSITLEFTKTPVSELFVEADRQKMKQVLLNLLSNAVKYNRDGGSVRVECEAGRLKPEDQGKKSEDRSWKTEDYQALPASDFGLRTIRISVTDTGNGISPEGIQKLFNPFQRIGAEATEVEGTGLGLAVSKKLMEAMNGTIGVESEPSVGSTFWIELPQAEGQIVRHERKGDFIKPETESVVSGTLLYIEDNVSNIQLVEQILEMHRPQISLISEMYGKRTVQLATDYQPDIILLDLDLPDIHGSEVLKQLLANNETKSIPVVILSADAMNDQIEKLLKDGAKKYLTKPLDVLEFLRVVDMMIEPSSKQNNKH